MGNSTQTSPQNQHMNLKFVVLLLTISMVMSARVTAPRRLGKLPSWAKNALKGCANAVIGTILDCIADEVKSLGIAKFKQIPGLKMVANKLVGKGIDMLVGKLKGLIKKAIDHAINKL